MLPGEWIQSAVPRAPIHLQPLHEASPASTNLANRHGICGGGWSASQQVLGGVLGGVLGLPYLHLVRMSVPTMRPGLPTVLMSAGAGATAPACEGSPDAYPAAVQYPTMQGEHGTGRGYLVCMKPKPTRSSTWLISSIHTYQLKINPVIDLVDFSKHKVTPRYRGRHGPVGEGRGHCPACAPQRRSHQSQSTLTCRGRISPLPPTLGPSRQPLE